VSKRGLYGAAALILILFTAARGTGGFFTAAIPMGVIYLASLKLSPRARHWRCKGTGQYQGILFRHAHRKCPGCRSGRTIRLGARVWGPAHIRAENATDKRIRALAKTNRSTR
jgi:hypothetical protein